MSWANNVVASTCFIFLAASSVTGEVGSIRRLETAPRAQSAAVTTEVNGSVAVVPFSNISGDSIDNWIGRGIAETVRADLREQGLPVLERTVLTEALGEPDTSERVDGNTDIQLVRDLGARWIVSGSYQRLGDQLRITARLIDVASGAVLRTAKVDGPIDDLFGLQDRIAAELVAGNGTTTSSARTALPPALRTEPVSSPIANAATANDRVSPRTPLGQRLAQEPPQATVVDPLPAPNRVVGVPDLGEVLGIPSTMGADSFVLPEAFVGPPPPMPPAVISRNELGQATIRAVRVTDLQLDGQLDESVYSSNGSITPFIQNLPNAGSPSSERTEAWVLYDDENLYVAARNWDSRPESDMVANEMRRDGSQIRQNDNFGVNLDTFYDRRNGVMFYTNFLGGMMDIQITNEGNPNMDWNAVWDVRTSRFDGGWSVEIQLPFKSLRYRPGRQQVWGIQMRRGIRGKNEFSFITPLPPQWGSNAWARASMAATLVGLEVPESGRNLEIKPYGISGLRTDRTISPVLSNEVNGDIGLDVKYGVTQNLTFDFTYNTDFAQVEVDERQINLTRFSLFFPEKREFFLEGRGIFDFARGPSGAFGGALRGGGSFFGASANAPTLFYTRRIGLDRGTIVPILGGGRLTGKVGAFDVGALNIQTDNETISGAKMTNFTVVRMKRDILRRSSVGALLTNRSVSLAGDGSNQAYGADASFSFYDNVNFLGYVAKTNTPGLDDKDTSYQGRFDYGADLYGLQVDHLVVEDNFVPEVGFVRRDNFSRTYTRGRFSPRPRSIEAIRQFQFAGSFDYIETADTGMVETRQSQLGFSTEFENSDRAGVSVANNYEFLVQPFTPGKGVTFPVGGYDFRDVEGRYSLGTQRRVSGTFTARAGEYFNGNIKSFGVRSGRIAVTPQLSIEPSLSFNWIDTPQGAFRTNLAVSRVNYSFTPRMSFSGLVQYNSRDSAVSNNLRLRWEYSPGSELFVVYTEDRDMDPLRPDRFSDLRNRGFVIKVNRLFRF